jgi:hypothetical protein
MTTKPDDDALTRQPRLGWKPGAQATAVAQAGGQAAWATGALSVSPCVWAYQLTDDGLALELTAKRTKYDRDADLN